MWMHRECILYTLLCTEVIVYDPESTCMQGHRQEHGHMQSVVNALFFAKQDRFRGERQHPPYYCSVPFLIPPVLGRKPSPLLSRSINLSLSQHRIKAPHHSPIPIEFFFSANLRSCVPGPRKPTNDSTARIKKVLSG